MRFPVMIVLLLLTIDSIAQDQIKIQRIRYSIKVPTGWRVDSSGLNGSDLFIFSALKDSSDTFSENVNVLIQELPNSDFNLDHYVDISEEQIKSYFKDSEITESKRIKAGLFEYHKVIYSGKINNRELKFEQYYFIQSATAYVVTYTAETSKFEEYKLIAEQVLNSFTFN